ncbi:MAG: putative multidrug export ATP-binding/permease protein [Elusimicrobia bacterium ADurb.Bin231]|nr:MAG: putative multidrug export ATP-binding/permease protein [Elusimicrobia bacterium ADurb.Bin231]
MEIIKRLLLYIKPYRKRFIYAMVCMVFVALSQSLLMLLVKPMIDKIFASHEKRFIVPIVAGVLTAGFFKFIFSYMQSYLLSWIGQSVVRDIRNDMYENLMGQSLDYFIKASTGKLISRLTYDVSLLQRGIVMIPRNVLRDGLYVIFYVGILFYLNWKWTIAIFVAFPIISLVIMTIGKKIRSRSRRSQSLTADIYSFLQERITGIKLIKSVTTEPMEIAVMKEKNWNYFNVFMRLTRADIIQGPLIEFLGVVGIATVMLWGGMEVINGSVTQGTFIAFIATAMSMYRPAKSLTDVNTDIQTATAAGERIFELLDKRPSVIEMPDAVEISSLERKISFEDVNFAYIPGKQVLCGINMEIKKGEIFAIVGPSGSGKTTVINLLARFFDPSSGRILIDGSDIRKFTFRSLRALMAIVTQETILFNDTIAANIAYGTAVTDPESIENAARLANAHGFISKLPHGYDTAIGEKGVTLSGGERQRLAIARVMLRNPQILILDEATSALDSNSELLVQEAISKLMKGRTTIVIAHRLSTIKSADMILLVDKGRISGMGSHEELFAKSLLYKKLYESQYLE